MPDPNQLFWALWTIALWFVAYTVNAAWEDAESYSRADHSGGPMPRLNLLFALYEERDEDGDHRVVVLDAGQKVLAQGRAARAHIVLNDALARLGNDEEPDR